MTIDEGYKLALLRYADQDVNIESKISFCPRQILEYRFRSLDHHAYHMYGWPLRRPMRLISASRR